MSFIWPGMLISLVSLPVFVGLYLLIQHRRKRLVEKYGNLVFSKSTGKKQPGLRRHIAPLIFLAALAVLSISLARPQMEVSLPSIEGTVILGFDVSGSMAADDFKPSRMEAAKAAAREFVQNQPSSVRIGVVAFSDSGFAVQAPTNDRGVVLSAIDRLEPQRGTSVGHGIIAALNVIAADYGTGNEPPILNDANLSQPPKTGKKYPSAMIVMLSDGENNETPDPAAAAQAAADLGVRVYTIGVGSPEGSILHIDGFSIHSQLDEATLKQIAQMTGAEYFNAADTASLEKIYSSIKPQLIIKPQNIEITSIFAGVSILVLLVGGLISMAWFGRLP